LVLPPEKFTGQRANALNWQSISSAAALSPSYCLTATMRFAQSAYAPNN
jgi:hypothetical protein